MCIIEDICLNTTLLVQNIFNLNKLIVSNFLPINFAATVGPTMKERLGAISDIRDSTYSNILSLQLVISKD